MNRYFAFAILTLLMCVFPTMQTAYAEDEVDPTVELKAASDFFKGIDIGELACDIKVLFDGSDQYSKDDIDKWNIAYGTYVFLGKYYYHDGGIFNLSVFGETVAESDAKTIDSSNANIVVPMVPLPGGIMCNDDIFKRYTVGFQGEVEVDGNMCNRIRLQPKDGDKEFFNYIEYSIDKKYKVIRKVDCAFGLGMWAGSGYGEFYYKKKRGKLLPSVGYGIIYFREPYQKRMTLWGKWGGFDIKSLDEISKDVKPVETLQEAPR